MWMFETKLIFVNYNKFTAFSSTDFTVFRKNTHSRFLLYLGGKCYTTFSGYVCEELFQMFIFYRETHYLQTCKHDVRITSPVTMNI